jgi:Kef-type K+ transport system membrane component KefB
LPVLGAVVVAVAAWPGVGWAAGAGAEVVGKLVVSPDLSELSQLGEQARTFRIMLIIFQVAAMLASAKLLGWAAERVKVPGVIGELLAGAIIGPYLLGSLIAVPVHGHWVPLFPRPVSPEQWPVNDVIWAVAQFASIVLLFVTGLHTDLKQFLRYVGPATLVAVVGLVVPFALGAGVVYIPVFSELAKGHPGESVLVPALFVGAILAATSIGITARVLSDIRKLDTPEGVTILGAAVLDDVLGIIALAIVGGIATAGSISVGAVGKIAFSAFGFWIGLTAVTLLLAKAIERAIGKIEYAGATVGLGLALAFACSGAAEGFGLAFIIGAYSVGLGLSRTKMAHRLMDELKPIGDFIVPIFFAALGMLVNFEAMLGDWRVIAFGLAVTGVAIVGKLVGCGAAAYATGFNARGAYRVGVGMMPRGEVALIVAGIGLSRHIIGPNVFGVSIMMTLLTTVLAPLLLVPAFARGGSGRKGAAAKEADLPGESQAPPLVVSTPAGVADAFLNRLLLVAEKHGWEPSYEQAEQEIYLLRSDGDAAQISCNNRVITIDASDSRQAEFVGLVDEARQSLIADVGACTAKPAGA